MYFSLLTAQTRPSSVYFLRRLIDLLPPTLFGLLHSQTDSKFNLCGSVSQDKNDALSCLLWAVELLFSRLSHFPFVVVLLYDGVDFGGGGKGRSQILLHSLKSSGWYNRPPLQRPPCCATLDIIRRRKRCNLQKARQSVVEQLLQTDTYTITSAGRCPCSFLHSLMFRHVVRKCYCRVLAS